MGVLRTLLGLPVTAPLNGTLWVADKVYEAAAQEVFNPAAIRNALHDLEQQLLAGDIDEDAYDAAETELLLRLKALT